MATSGWWLGGGGGRRRNFLTGGAGRAASSWSILVSIASCAEDRGDSGGAVLGGSTAEVPQTQFTDRVRPSWCQQRQEVPQVQFFGQVVRRLRVSAHRHDRRVASRRTHVRPRRLPKEFPTFSS